MRFKQTYNDLLRNVSTLDLSAYRAVDSPMQGNTRGDRSSFASHRDSCRGRPAEHTLQTQSIVPLPPGGYSWRGCLVLAGSRDSASCALCKHSHETITYKFCQIQNTTI